VLGISLGLSLVVAEIAVRLVAPQQLIVARPDIWQAVDTLGWMHRPNVNTTINTGERPVPFLTDAEGLRVGAKGRIAGAKRVMLIGDSFVAAMQVPYEQSIAGLLEQRLSERLGVPVAIRNAGVNGYSPSQYLMWVRRLAEREPFDAAVVLLYLGNDVLDWRTERQQPFQQTVLRTFHWPARLTWSEIVSSLLYPLNDFLKQRSHLFVLAKNQARTLLMRLGLTYLYIPEEILRENANKPRWQITADVCRDIAAAAAARHIPVLFVLVPGNYQVEPAVFQQYLEGFDIEPATVDLEQPNRLLGATLAPYHLRTLDLLDTLRVEQRKGERLYGRVDVHFSPEGNDVVERILEPTIIEMLRTAH